MKKNTKILLGITAITAAAVAVIILYRKRSYNDDDHDMLSQVSEEGYETAHDVLFPNKSKKGRDKDLRYGPVIPK